MDLSEVWNLFLPATENIFHSVCTIAIFSLYTDNFDWLQANTQNMQKGKHRVVTYNEASEYMESIELYYSKIKERR